ncbi:MAG: hypothetical protein QM788_01215 [Roseateles sp.]|uniref:hypothetical protein n=1 Tax=Roseateles sp. TaxID=1971397 RepID=UPI0039EB4620
MRAAIRPVGAADASAFTAAARASRRLHRPWVTAPCDAEAFARYLARFDGVAHHGFVVVAEGELAGAVHLTNVVMARCAAATWATSRSRVSRAAG